MKTGNWNLLRGLFGAALSLLALGPAQAADASAALQRFLDRVDSLQAQFTQTQTDEQGKLLQTSGGQMWLQRGGQSGRFRWNYRAPYAQEIVCDGRKIWLYDPDLSQVTVRPAAEALDGTPAALLAQRAALSQGYTVSDGGQEAGLQKVVLKPKSADSEFRSIELWLQGELPQRLRFQDPLGGFTEIRFSDLRANTAIPGGTFEFKPPKGVEVIDGGQR